MNNVFHTVLLLALPASGKSEVRNFMAHMDGERLAEDFHIGANLQLDDFPYVHFMRRIDDELEKAGKARIFFKSKEEPFFRAEDWGTLVQLLNEDYDDLLNSRRHTGGQDALHLFQRIDEASVRGGSPARINALDKETKNLLAEILEKEACAIRKEKEAQYTNDFAGKTIVIEAARGGPDGSTMPLTGAYGYQYTLRQFSEEVLAHAAILYILVTPEESRRKNAERAHPDDPGSNLFHGVPTQVLLQDYGCDDMLYLIDQSDVPHTVRVEAHGKTWHIPVGVFDNRVDKTSFLRADESEWDEKMVAEVTQAIHGATQAMWENYT